MKADAEATELQGNGEALGGIHPEEKRKRDPKQKFERRKRRQTARSKTRLDEAKPKTRLDEASPPKTRPDEEAGAKCYVISSYPGAGRGEYHAHDPRFPTAIPSVVRSTRGAGYSGAAGSACSNRVRTSPLAGSSRTTRVFQVSAS